MFSRERVASSPRWTGVLQLRGFQTQYEAFPPVNVFCVPCFAFPFLWKAFFPSDGSRPPLGIHYQYLETEVERSIRWTQVSDSNQYFPLVFPSRFHVPVQPSCLFIL